MSITACNNAERIYIPPALIMNGVRENAEFNDGLPPDSKAFMNLKSSCIYQYLFLSGLKNTGCPFSTNE
jgi:hypothetical protein